MSKALLKNYALNLLARRAHSVKEIESKLLKKMQKMTQSIDSTIIDQIVKEFLEKKYLDDKLFAEQFVRYQIIRAPQGKYMLECKLAKKGVSEDLIKQAIAKELLEIEADLAIKQSRKKYLILVNKSQLSNMQIEQKISMNLISRGFNFGIIAKIIKQKLYKDDYKV